MATSIRNARKSPTAPPHGFWSPLLITGGVIVLLIVLSIVVLSLIRGGVGMTKEQAAMEQYLEKKYGQEFVVNEPKYKGGGFGVDGTWQSTASPVTNKALTFRVGAAKELDSFSDQYVAAIWSEEQTRKIQPKVKDIYSENTATTVAVRIIFSRDLIKDATLTSPTYDNAKKDYADRGFYYEYIINAPLNANISVEAANAYKLIELARKEGVKKIGVSYVEKRDDDEWVCTLESADTATMTDSTGIEKCLDHKVKVEE